VWNLDTYSLRKALGAARHAQKRRNRQLTQPGATPTLIKSITLYTILSTESAAAGATVPASAAAAHDQAASKVLARLTKQYALRGWQPPEAAQREDGLWLLRPKTIMRKHMLRSWGGHAYGSSWHDRSGADLPIVECTRSAGAPLPPLALELVRSGMCCVLNGARLWPAAEDKWGGAGAGGAEYLREQLRGVDCSVLSSPATSRRFSYYFDSSHGRKPGVAGVAGVAGAAEQPNYAATPNYSTAPIVERLTMSIDEYLEQQQPHSQPPPPPSSQPPPAARCLYLQHCLLQAGANGAGLNPCLGLGESMREDCVSGIDTASVGALAQAGAFGAWQRSQLFVGGSSARGARSILHFDQYDNLFVQISGSKRFKIYDPQQTRNLYPYPVHHPMDTRSRVDLERPDYDAFPWLARAEGFELVLHPGQTLFLPAYWWHEVITEPTISEDELTISVNFWFEATARSTCPTLPLVPSNLVELARQMEYLLADCLADDLPPAYDGSIHVPAFLESMCDALGAVTAASRRILHLEEDVEAEVKAALHAVRPANVPFDAWQGSFEFVVWKLSLLIGTEHVLAFARDLLWPHGRKWPSSPMSSPRTCAKTCAKTGANEEVAV
jgi:hypoxia-inducible factor 1-alpha inhibitor (HIF hydroxylase)